MIRCQSRAVLRGPMPVVKHDLSDREIPRDEFGDELDEPALWESGLVLCLYPLYRLGVALRRLLRRRRIAAMRSCIRGTGGA
jgi:hypothetical protein